MNADTRPERVEGNADGKRKSDTAKHKKWTGFTGLTGFDQRL
jgi:hypothetical protein